MLLRNLDYRSFGFGVRASNFNSGCAFGIRLLGFLRWVLRAGLKHRKWVVAKELKFSHYNKETQLPVTYYIPISW